MGLQEMLHWWNLIYLVPLVISVAWILTTVFSGMHGHGHDVSHDVGHVGHDVAHAIGHAMHHGGDAGHGHDLGHNGSAHGHDAHGDAHSDGSNTTARLIMLFGFGQVPITLLIGVFLLCWGAFGMLFNQVFGILKYPGIYIWPSLGLTFVVSAAITRSMAAIVGRLIPGEETYGVSRFELIGLLGRTVFSTTESSGTVDIKDPSGTVHRMQAKVEPGKEPIPSGSDVIVVDLDENDNRYVIRQGKV